MLKINRKREKIEFPEILNQDQAARFLGMSRSNLRKALLTGKIPGRVLGKRYFFSKSVLLRWLESDLAEKPQNR